MTEGVDGMSGAATFRRRLLPATLENAARFAFYRERWALQDGSPSALGELPTVSATRDRSRLTGLRDPELEPVLMSFTTGTTRLPFVRYRSREELDAYAEYATTLIRKVADADGKPATTVAFNAVPASSHGATMPRPAVRRIDLDLRSKAGVTAAVRLLSDESLFVYDGPSPTRVLVGTPDVLVAFALTCRREGVDTSGLRLDAVYSIGALLTTSVHALLGREFDGAAVLDVFGCSEIIGGSMRCAECSAYHFEPLVWPEVLELDTDRAIESGPGELTLTELHPFSQIQPLIRYRTGDLVERVSCPKDPLEVAFRPLGRRRASVTVAEDGHEKVVLAARDLREGLESVPGVARAAFRSWPEHPLYGAPVGAPLATWTFDRDERRLAVAVELSFSPSLYRDHALALAEQLVHEVRAAVRHDAFDVVVELHEPGTGIGEFTGDARCDAPLVPPWHSTGRRVGRAATPSV